MTARVAPVPSPWASGLTRLLRAREAGTAALVLLVFALATLKNHHFASGNSVQQLLVGASLIALLGVGETMVIVTRNIDLSVGSVLGLSAFVVGDLFRSQHIPVWSGFVIAIALGAAIGAINGLITTVARVPSLVVTLATLYIFRGVDILIVGGKEVVASSLPSAFLDIPKATVFGLPDLAIAIAVVIGIGAYYLRSFRSGRELYAIGSNPDAARLAGIPSGKRVFMAFMVSGAIAGVAGVLWAAQYGTVDSTAGTGYELQVISAVVVGGVAIFGGSGSAVGAALGALLLNTISSALYVLGISPFWDQAIWGFLLIVAISVDRFISVRLTAALRVRGARHE